MHEMLNSILSECPYLTSLQLAPFVVWIMNILLVCSYNLTVALREVHP